MAEKDVLMVENCRTFNSFVSGNPMITIENQRIFPKYSLVYLLHFFVHYPPSFYTLFCFLFVPLFCIHIGVSILSNSLIQ